MSDEDAPTFEPPRAAIPSRASGSLLPQPSPLPPVVEAPSRPRRKATAAPAKKTRSQRLPEAEIKRIKTNRRKNLSRAKTIAKAKVVKRAVKAAAPKNPNRPLELKNQMAAILATATKLTREELGGFMIAIETVGKLSRKGRAKVIAALANTYGIQL